MSSGFGYPPWDNKLILQGDASFIENVLLLTLVDTEDNPRPSSVGRALHPVHVDLKDSRGQLVGFETTFTFRISSSHAHDNIVGPGYGLAFFITDTDPPADSFGEKLGIFQPPRIVAVEFVTHTPPDVGHPYVRIINPVTPSASAKWKWQDGEKATAKVTYIPPREAGKPGTLTVEASYPDGSRVYLPCDVPLDTIFPERVRVGLSASTEKQCAQKNEVLSWSFGTN